MQSKLLRRFYRRKTRTVAKQLLGKILVHKTNEGIISGKIVETEAYLGQRDPGSHASRGITERNKIMFGRAGIAYIYFVYGKHYCLNIVTEKEGVAGAVLIRALEPIDGIELMKRNREKDWLWVRLTNGPGRLTQALGITSSMNGTDLTGNRLFVMSRAQCKTERNSSIISTGRVGIKKGDKLPYRYHIEGNSFVSRSYPA